MGRFDTSPLAAGLLALALALGALSCSRPGPKADAPAPGRADRPGDGSDGATTTIPWRTLDPGAPWWPGHRQPPPEADPTAACEAGDGRACFVIGSILERHQGDDDQARLAYERACELGIPPACYNLGIFYQRGRGVEKDYARAVAHLVSACEAGWPEACGELGFMLERGVGVEADRGAAMAVYEEACEAGDLRACNNLAFLLRLSDPPQWKRALSLYRRTCDLGYPRACARAGYVLAQGCQRGDPGCDEGLHIDIGEGDDAWDRRLADLLEPECRRRGTAEACLALGRNLEAGEFYERDLERAHDLAAEACDLGIAWGCHDLADYYRRGRGVEADLGRAADLYRKACDGGFLLSCQDLAVMIVNGDVPGERKDGIALMDRACQDGSVETCVELVWLCAAGLADACER